jgi:hypothetical protein
MMMAFARAFLALQSANCPSYDEFGAVFLFEVEVGGCDWSEGGRGLGYEFEGFGVDLAPPFGFRGIFESEPNHSMFSWQHIISIRKRKSKWKGA